MTEHENFEAFRHAMGTRRILAMTTKGSRGYSEINYREEDVLLFGSETRGLPDDILRLAGERHCLRIPMQSDSRSLNLSNAAAIVVYEAWRQLGFR